MLDVADRSAALIQIERQGLFPVAVDAAKGGAMAAAMERPSSRAKADWKTLLPPTLRAALSQKRKPKLQELSTFTQQLANLLNSGMPLTVALNSMTHLESRGISADVSRDLRQDVMEGHSLSDSMTKQPRIFSDLYVNMVRAGESSGALVEVLRRMADHFERFAQVQAKFTSALIYPAFVAVVGICIMFFFMTYMLPKFMSIFQGMNVQLPFITQVLVNISHMFASYWWLMLATIFVGFILFKRFQSSKEGRRKLDQWKMKAPIFGKVIRLNLFGQFARTLSTLLAGGLPLLNALETAANSIGNRAMGQAVGSCTAKIREGASLTVALESTGMLESLPLEMVKVGEQTGALGDMLNAVSEFYDEDLDIRIATVLSLVEPVLLVVMAVVVAGMLLAFYLPMFDAISAVQSKIH